MEAEKFYIEHHAMEQLTKLNHTIARAYLDPQVSDIIIFWRHWLGQAGKASLSGAWRGPARVAVIEPPVRFREESRGPDGRAGRIVWVIHGAMLRRCHPTQLRRASASEATFGFQHGVPRVMPGSLD